MRGSKAKREHLVTARVAAAAAKKSNHPPAELPDTQPPHLEASDVEMPSESEAETSGYNLRRPSFGKSYSEKQRSRPTTESSKTNRRINAKKARQEALKKNQSLRERLATIREVKQNPTPTGEEFAQEQLDIVTEVGTTADDLNDEVEKRCQAVGSLMDQNEELSLTLKELQNATKKQKQLNNEKKAITMRFQRELDKQKTTNKNLNKKINRRDFFHQQARKPFTDLESRNSRFEVVKRFCAIVTTFFSIYVFQDFFAISRLAWPNINAPVSMLSAAQTWQFMSELNISFTKMCVMKRFLKECSLNVFASESHVYQLIKLVANATKYFTKLLKLKSGIECKIRCASIQSLKELIKQRVIAQIKGGKFPKRLKHLRLCIGFDKGGTTTKMCLMMGSIKGRNGPRNMSLLALYEGNESPEELIAAFQQIIDECKSIKQICVGERIIKVSFRFTGDLKCLKACLGLLGGNPNYPCLYCLQFKETTFESYTPGAGPVRSNFIFEQHHHGQGHSGCLSWIKPHQIVLPSLHLMMGAAEKVFDLLISRICIKEAISDFNGFNMVEVRKKHEALADASDELKTERERMNDWIKIKENFESKTLPVQEKRWPEGCNRRTWFGDICCSSNCISEISDIILPCRISGSDDEVPDWLEDKDKMWFHSICLGLSDEHSIRAGVDNGYESLFKTKEQMIIEIQREIDKSGENVNKIQADVQTQLQRINMPKDFDEHPTVNALFKVFEKFGAYKTAFFQRFTGNHIRAILNSAIPEEDGTSKLQKKITECEELKCFIVENNEKYDLQFKLGMDALHILALIQDSFKSDYLTDAELEILREDVNELEGIMNRLPEVRVGHKFHLLLKHVPDVAERDKTIGFFSEHGIESMHALVNQLMRRLTVRSDEARLERVIQFVNSVAVTRDQYGEIDPLKRKNIELGKQTVVLEEPEDDEEDDEYDILLPSDLEDDDEEPTEEEKIVISLAELSAE